LADAEPKPVFSRGFLERSNNVLPRSHLDRVPTIVLRIPQIEIIVMHAHADEVLRAGFLIQADQMVGIELVALPCRNDVLEAELAWMAVGRHVKLVLFVALDVDVAGVPIALLGRRLRTPMRPDAELRVTIPLGDLVRLERIARTFELTFSDLEALCIEPGCPA